MIQAPHAACFNCRRPGTGRIVPSPATICSSVAPAAAAAAAAPRAFATLCRPPRCSAISACPSGLERRNRVRKPSAPSVVRRSDARKSAALAMPNVTTRAAVIPRQRLTNSSSAFNTAVASAARPATVSPSARATPSRLPNPSRCSAPALVMSPTVGRATLTSSATSPARLAPISITAKRWPGSSRSSVSGTPMWLLRLPRVARQLPARERMAAVISLAVVLPLLPATPTTGMSSACAPRVSGGVRARPGCPRRRSARAHRAVAHRRPRRPRRPQPRRSTNSLPLKRGPRSATKRSPADSVAAVARHAGEGAVGTLEPSTAGPGEVSQRPLDCRTYRSRLHRLERRARHALIAERTALAAVESDTPRAPCRQSTPRLRRPIAPACAPDGARAVVLDLDRNTVRNAGQDLAHDALRETRCAGCRR